MLFPVFRLQKGDSMIKEMVCTVKVTHRFGFHAIWKSTKFAGTEGKIPELYDELKKLSKEAYPYYEELKKHCI